MVDAGAARRAMKTFRMPRRRRTETAGSASGRRRKRMAVVRLGGDGGSGGVGGGAHRRRFLGALRRVRVRVRWLAALYRRTLRRLRASYAKAIRELIEGRALLGVLNAPSGVDCSRAASFGPVATVGF